MVLTYKGRLPGVAVEQAPQQTENTLRMDVPGIVGFAERGPLDTPIMIEDIQQYRAVFGGDVFLAQDKGVPVYAQLPRAVQAFFDNGGRRCYVVRVAGSSARPNHFRVPGLVIWGAQEGLRSVERPAAWAGRWSDNVSIATRLRRRPLRLYRPWEAVEFQFHPETLRLNTVKLNVSLPNAQTVLPNDLITIHAGDSDLSQIFMRVKTIEQLGYGSYESAEWQGIPVRLTGEAPEMTAFSMSFNLPPIEALEAVQYGYWADEPSPGHMDWYALPRPRSADLKVDVAQGDLYDFDFFIVESQQTEAKHAHHCCLCRESRPKEVYVALPQWEETRNTQNDILRLIYQNGLIVEFPVKESRPTTIDGVRKRQVLRVFSERLTFSREALRKVEILEGNGWQPMALPSSGLIFIPGSRTQPYSLHFRTVERLLGANDLLRLTFEGGNVFLFPVSSFDWKYLDDGQPELILSSTLLLVETNTSTLSASDVKQVDLLAFDLYTREGNSQLESWTGRSFGHSGAAFWENILARPAQDKDIRTAQDILQNRSTRLGLPTGRKENEPIPFYLPLNMLERQPQFNDFEGALPDDPWTRGGKDGLDRFSPVELFLDADFHKSDSEERLKPSEIAALANQKLYFREKDEKSSNPDAIKPLEKPKKLHSLYEIDEVSLIAIPELGDRCWEPPRRNIRRIRRVETASGCGCGSRFYPCKPPLRPTPPQRELPFQRQREERDALLREGDIRSRLYRRLAKLPTLVPFEDDCGCDDSQMIVVQRALVNMCTARGDVIAILSLPQHYALRDVLDWHQQIVCPRDKNVWDKNAWETWFICPRDSLDDRALGYAAVYHGWMSVREDLTPELKPLRTIAPDGTILGMIATRTLERGPGIAPANQSMRGVVGLKPEITDAEWELFFNRQINVLRQRPGRFTILSAHTLSLDPLAMKLSIKRLTIYIRKLILREGQRYVFESNTPRFRRSVQAMFERVMNRLLTQGALVGYHVDATDRVNSPQDVDAGRFVVEIKYAPTHPVEFITIVLLRTGESLLEVLER